MEERPEGRTISHRRVLSYIDRTREYYAALGYEKPYRWAHYATVPFTRLSMPLAECTVGLITTASPRAEGEPSAGVLRGDKRVWTGTTVEAPKSLYTDHLSWHKEATHTNDVNSFLPIESLQRLASQGRVGQLSPRFYGVPTDYSQRRNRDEDAPEILRLCREDGVDVALLAAL